MKAAILTIGDEILIGQIVDTNSAWLGQKLNDLGIRVNSIVSLPDDETQIIEGIRKAVDEHDIVFLTGGLGPTKDDITKVAIAKYLGVELFFHEETFERIKRIFEKMGREMSPHHHDQCLMPAGVEILKNSLGTAPGMLFKPNGKMMVSMPGVPFEMKAIMTEVVLPMLQETQELPKIFHRTIMTACTGETTIENQISGIIAELPPYIKVAYLPSLAAVRVRISGYGTEGRDITDEVMSCTKKITDTLGDIVYGYDDTSLPEVILSLAVAKGKTIGTAESCTGGNIAHELTSISGSSAYFMGSVVAYADGIKTNLLGVDPMTISSYGAVSEQTVIEMVAGACKILGVDIAVSISGIAGPTGGSEAKPVGTMWLCVGSPDRYVTYLLRAGKDREKNVQIATIYALDMLRKFLM
jgi:nicotinamide-nucleotide amidase